VAFKLFNALFPMTGAAKIAVVGVSCFGVVVEVVFVALLEAMVLRSFGRLTTDIAGAGSLAYSLDRIPVKRVIALGLIPCRNWSKLSLLVRILAKSQYRC
jgi:hypothetical protein